MSNKTNPRPLKLKKYPKGIFKWKVAFELNVNPRRKFKYYDRYCDETCTVGEEVEQYLRDNCSGKFSFHYIDVATEFGVPAVRKRDFVYLENKYDVMMLKLVHGAKIRNIYEIIVE